MDLTRRGGQHIRVPRGDETIPGRILRAVEIADGVRWRLLHLGRADEVIGYAALVDRALAWAAHLRVYGARPGDRVVILRSHGLHLYAAFVGSLLGGFVPAIFAPPSEKFSRALFFETIDRLLENAAPRLLVIEPSLVPDVAGRIAGLPDVGLVSAPPDEAVAPSDALPPAARPDDVAFLQYSSGTTGLKKGVAVSHRALLRQVDAYADAIGLDERDVIASWLPVYHDMGLVACLLMPLVRPTSLVAMSPLEWVRRPSMLWRAVSDHRATLCWLPNFAYNFMAQRVRADEIEGVDLSGLRGVVNCSEPVLASSQRVLLERFGPHGLRPEALAASYAMAENTFAATSAGFPGPPVEERIDAAVFAREGRAAPAADGAPAREMVGSGRALPGVEVSIRDADGRPVPDRTVGEIVLRSPFLLDGYFRNPEVTAAALRDGALRTGDLGYLAEGELFVAGRMKEILIVGGVNIYPQDVEAAAGACPGAIPGRCAAFGIPNPETGTEDLILLVETAVTDPERRRALAASIRTAVAERVEVSPRDVRLLPERWLQKSSSGKISRGANRDRYLEMIRDETDRVRGGAATSGAASLDVVDAIRACVRRVLDSNPATRGAAPADTDPLLSSGLVDSFGVATLLADVERACGFRIPDEALRDPARIDTVAAIAALVSGAPAPPRALSPTPAVAGPSERVVDRSSLPRTARRGSPFWTLLYRFLFRRMGVRCGPGLKVLGPLLLRLEGGPGRLEIGANVCLMPMVDFKIRENGRIVLRDGVFLDTGVRLLAARDAVVEIGARTAIGSNSTVSGGADVVIGRDCLFGAGCVLHSSEHRFEGPGPIFDQGYVHAPVSIGDDVWLASLITVELGAKIGRGAVIGAHAHVRGAIPPYSICLGQPARPVRWRRSPEGD